MQVIGNLFSVRDRLRENGRYYFSDKVSYMHFGLADFFYELFHLAMPNRQKSIKGVDMNSKSNSKWVDDKLVDVNVLLSFVFNIWLSLMSPVHFFLFCNFSHTFSKGVAFGSHGGV